VAFPATTVQTCIVHLIRRSLDYATYKERKALARELRPIYTAAT
jgi:transposase-like protein